MRSTEFLRAEEVFLNSVAHALQIAADFTPPKGKMPCDVLEEDQGGGDFGNNPGQRGPQVARIILAPSFSGGAERLARVARRDDIHDSTPRAAIEGLDIVPYRSRLQDRISHPRHEDGRGVGFPFTVTHSSIGVPESEMEPEFETPCPGTKSQAIHGPLFT